MSDHPRPKRLKNMLSFYKKDNNNQTSTPTALDSPMPCTSLPINEVGIPSEHDTRSSVPPTETPIPCTSLPSNEVETPSEHDTSVPPTVTNASTSSTWTRFASLLRSFILKTVTFEVIALRLQLEHYKHQVVSDKDFQKLSTLTQLCRRLVETELAQLFPLVDRLIRLVLMLPVSTATTERAFSAMKIIKTRLRNKMEDEYLSGCMMLHIEKQYVDTTDSEEVIDHFESIGDRRAQFR